MSHCFSIVQLNHIKNNHIISGPLLQQKNKIFIDIILPIAFSLRLPLPGLAFTQSIFLKDLKNNNKKIKGLKYSLLIWWCELSAAPGQASAWGFNPQL